MAPSRSLGDRLAWPAAGLVAGLFGMAVSFLAARLLDLALVPVGAVGQLVIRLTPGQAVEAGIQSVGSNDKPLLLLGIWVVLLVAFAAIGALARRVWWAPLVGFGVLAAIGLIAYLTDPQASVGDVVPILVGYLAWTLGAQALTERLRRAELITDAGAGEAAGAARRTFLGISGGLAFAAVATTAVGRLAGRSRAAAESARANLQLPISQPSVPEGVAVDVPGVSSWMTSVDDFYRVDTIFLSPPALTPEKWSLRIHGMVENEITLTFDDLLGRDLVEEWVTLNCVSNPVGGRYIGNAWWSGVRLDAIIKMASPLAGADAILQTSDDGWTCGTPLAAVTDGRPAMLAVAMNGAPLPIEHGFPVRTIVPGLYGYVSATKWVRDMEVTQFSKFDAYWTQRGWGELGPVKIASRIDVPRANGRVAAGDVVVAGSAWFQDTGISGVQISVDGGEWTDATLATAATIDSWVQWRATAPVGPGDHQVKVRALDKDGNVQTGVQRGVLPDGATGWHTVQFTAT